MSLKQLVSRAAKKRKSDQISLSSAFLDRFTNEELTDLEFHVRYPDAEPATRRAKAVEEDPTSHQEEHMIKSRVIKGHSLLLSSRSNYLKRLLLGEWRESSDRSVTIEVEDEQGGYPRMQ